MPGRVLYFATQSLSVNQSRLGGILFLFSVHQRLLIGVDNLLLSTCVYTPPFFTTQSSSVKRSRLGSISFSFSVHQHLLIGVDNLLSSTHIYTFCCQYDKNKTDSQKVNGWNSTQDSSPSSQTYSSHCTDHGASYPYNCATACSLSWAIQFAAWCLC